MIWWLAVAFGADGVDGLLLPGASPLESTVAVGTWAAGGFAPDAFAAAVIGLDYSVGYQRVSLIGILGYCSYSLGLEPIRTGPVEGATSPLVGQIVSLRFLAVETESIRFAPMVTHTLSSWAPAEGTVGIGAAFEGGTDVFRIDVSVPSIAALRFGAPLSPVTGLPLGLGSALFEAGVTFPVNDVHALRLGFPALTWSVRTCHFMYDLSVPAVVFPAAAMKIGVRLGRSCDKRSASHVSDSG